MKSIGNEPSMSIYKAMHALTYALREANERVHYAEGTAALAMKHRTKRRPSSRMRGRRWSRSLMPPARLRQRSAGRNR